MGNKGYFFTLDALFGIILIGMALVLTSKYYISEIEQPQLNYYSYDIIEILSTIKITEVDDPYVTYLISEGEIINFNNSIIEQIGEFYVLNKTGLAQNLSHVVFENLIPDKYGFEIIIESDTIYYNDSVSPLNTELVSSRRLISGIEKFKPIRGATSKVYLDSIESKLFSTYLYFGGFVGQGNVTGFIDDIPTGANISAIYLEVDAGSDFQLYINNNLCSNNLTSGSGIMTSDAWDLSSCKNDLLAGAKNNFSVVFTEDLNEAFFGGGYIRVDYYTDQLKFEEPSHFKEYLPGISGIVNLYSSFYVPGTLDNISVYLHYDIGEMNITNNTFYLTIGNITIYQDKNFSGEKNYTITVENITAFMPLSSMDEQTVPIRIGFENVSFGYYFEGSADVALVTDISGSMDWRMDNNNVGTARNCNDPNLDLASTARLSVAKCLDKEFSQNIINITGNQVGLTAYDAVTHAGETVYPTTDFSILNATIGTAVPQTGYEGSGSTCICCGINSATAILVENLTTITLISAGDDWMYNNNSFNSIPGQDPFGNSWYDHTYTNDTQWFIGSNILGSTNSYVYTPTVDTEIGSDLLGNTLYPDLWENNGDTGGPPADFSSGTLNSTANTFGIGAGDDGWDWQAGTYTYGNAVQFDGISSGRLQMFTNDNSNSVSGAYGIEVVITSEMYDIINSPNSRATVSFNYRWDETGSFEGYEDQVWIKGRWVSPTSGVHWLGADLDAATDNPDATNEIDVRNDPDADITNGFFSQEISAWIEASGNYYLDFGGKLLRDYTNEEGHFRFDNIQIEISNSTDHYYFRKHFNISDLDQVQKGILNVMSDDNARVYLNGVLVDEDLEIHEAEYWNRRGKTILGSNFRLGDNVIAVEVQNSEEAAKFDLELIGIDESRDKAMMVMTDGQANEDAGCPQSGTPTEEAIEAACDAREDYGIKVYAVGFSDNADEPTLQAIAECGDAIYRKSDNITALQEFYSDVALSIVSASRHSQTIEIQGNLSASTLFDDSYIDIDYTPTASPPGFGEIDIIVEEKNFDNCTFDVTIPSDVRVSDAKLTSYSAEHWTDALLVNNNEIYNLTKYSSYYGGLGDPFVINIPVDTLLPGNNTFYIRTGDSPENFTGCSLNNTLIYTAQIMASVSYSDVLEKAVGCSWDIEVEDGSFANVSVPPDYTGSKLCLYTNVSHVHIGDDFDWNDTYDDAMHTLLDNLDFDNDGRIYVNIEEKNFFVGAISIGKIPYPWGPATVKVKVWK